LKQAEDEIGPENFTIKATDPLVRKVLRLCGWSEFS
jgi:hypothetical protein